MNFRLIAFLFISLFLIVTACSTEKNSFINRTYHGTTAKYNGLFNANELLDQSLKSYRNTAKEDYYSVLPLTQLPNEEEVMGMYPAIDTAISKCTKVISNHSMPTADEPSKKKVEYNHWIDENWIAIGRSLYFRRDYDGAIRNFEFVRKFFKTDPSNYEATLWIAKSQLEIKEYGKAKINLDLLDLAVKETDEINSTKKKLFSREKSNAETGKKMSKAAKKRLKKKNKKAKKSGKDKEDEKALFPKEIRLELEKTKAQLALLRKENDLAITYLDEALKFAKKKEDKARLHFITAQLAQKMGNTEKSKFHYGQVLKNNAPFEMDFNARINRAIAGGSGDPKIKKQLLKMSRESKNAEFKDQIYYAMAEVAIQENKKEQGIIYLHRSTFYSTTNPRQKGRSYERLADLSFADKNYIKAQKYYDSCAKVMPENYPNADGIRNKATRLKDLVIAVEAANYEDSIQRIAKLSPEEQEAFATNVIKKMKEDDERRKALEAEKLKELQTVAASVGQEQLSGNKSYWNNSKLRSSGFDDFRKQWGQRENEDNWRRTDKIIVVPSTTETAEDIAGNEDNKGKEQSKESGPTVEQLLSKIPVGDSAIAASNERLVAALYDAGIIYKDLLNENDIAAKQFENVLTREVESDYKAMSSFQLYKIYETSDVTKANIQKEYLLTYFPNSDYSNYLRDPDFFVKRKMIEKLNEEDYVVVLERYNRGLYYPVISKADDVIENEKKNPFRAKYMLLKALSLGQLNVDKSPIVPVLTQLIAEYPNTQEEARGKEMLGIIKNGYSANIESDFSKKEIYTYVDKAEMWVVIFPSVDDQKNLGLTQSNVSDFNKEYFSRSKLSTDLKVLGGDINVIVVKKMTEKEAKVYLAKFKKTKKYLGNLQNAKTFFISKENLVKLIETNKLEEYDYFFLENY
ncbi:MAG: tetratricopeptide repeat protein [Crocinitomicaceae bacterium]|nr:tetratricopeptide repeat protein [Crocinitomicaceae bacterium]